MGDAGEGGADADVEMEMDTAPPGMAVEQQGEFAPTAELPAADAATLTAQEHPPQGGAGGDRASPAKVRARGRPRKEETGQPREDQIRFALS